MSVTTTSTRDLLETPVLKSAISKASRRLMPMLVILYVVAFLDRTNVGFAEAALGVDKGITAGAYALGAGIFFIGYALFEIPSNLLLTKFGAKVWLARIAITWGIVSACFAFVQGETSFIILRFLLGVTEAGLFPGVIMFLAAWFPNKVRVKMFAIFYLAQPFSQMMGAPLSGWLINIGDQVPGVQGWQVMFFVEGMLAVVAGIAAYFFLINSPQDAKFLNKDEKNALLEVMALEDTVKEESGPRGVLAAMKNGKVWYFTVIYFCLQIAVYGVTFYLPQQVAQLTGQKVGLAVGLMAAIPWFFGIFACYFIGKAANTVVRRRVLGHRAVHLHRTLHLRFRVGWSKPHSGTRHHLHHPRSVLLPFHRSHRLVLPDGVPHRNGCGRGNRPDQLTRQPRRLRRPDPADLGQPDHRLGHRDHGRLRTRSATVPGSGHDVRDPPIQEQGRRVAGAVRPPAPAFQRPTTGSSRKHQQMQQSSGSQTFTNQILVGVSTKMYLGYGDSLDWLERLRHEVDTRPALAAGRVVPFVIPSFPVLPEAARLLAGSPLLLGAQNCGWADGPWTGEVAPSMLAELGVRLVEIGHAERRKHFNEDDAMVALKVRAADDAGLTPLLCVGEHRPRRAGGRSGFRATARSSPPSTATGTSPAGSPLPTNPSGPSARPSPPLRRTCPTSSSGSGRSSPWLACQGCRSSMAVRPSPDCCPRLRVSRACSWAGLRTILRTSARYWTRHSCWPKASPRRN